MNMICMVQRRILESEIKGKILEKGPRNLSQLALALKCNRNSLQKELERLCENNTLRKEKIGNETRYEINSDYSTDESFLFLDLGRMHEVEKKLDSIIAKKYDAKYWDSETKRFGKDGLDWLYELGKIRPVFTITNEARGYGPINKSEEEEWERIGMKRPFFSFKTNPKAEKPLYKISGFMDWCVSKSVEASFLEIFHPNDVKTALGINGRKELQRLGIIVAERIRDFLISSDDPKFEKCYTMYLHNQSSLWIQLRDAISMAPKEYSKMNTGLTDLELHKLGVQYMKS